MTPSDAATAETAVEAVVALDGTLRREGRRERPHLLLAGDRLYLTDAPWLDTRFRVDALAEGIQYRPGRLRDRLEIGARKLTVPRGEGQHARRMIALARVRSTGHGCAAIPKAGVYLEAIGDLEREWLSRHLERDEVLLAWLHTAHSWVLRSELARGKEKVTASFFLTSTRAGLVAVTELGDVRETTIPRGRLDVRRNLGRDVILAGAERFRATLKNGKLFAELAELPALSAEARVYDVARATFAARHRDRHLDEIAADLLHHGATLGDPRARLANEALADRARDDLDEAVRALERDLDSAAFGRALVDVLKSWELSPTRAHRLLDAVERASADREARLVLHRAVRERSIAQTRDLVERADHDITLSRALHAAGAAGEAMRVLRDRLATLPDPALLDLIPHPDDRGAAPPIRTRVRLLDAIAELATEPESRLSAIVDVAQLEPLDPGRLEAVAASADASLAARAEAARRAILAGGLAPRGEPVTHPAVRPLDPAELERLRHPLARAEGALAKLQALLASVEAPDHESLRAFCDRLQTDAGPESAGAQSALTDATILLGARSAEAYISRGERSVGVRAYEGRPPFLLIGGDHLTPGSEWALSPGELRFAIGEEVAHLRFGHARVTTTALWSGILEKSKTAVDLLIGALPLFRSLKFAGKLGDITGYLRDAQIIRAIDTAQRLVIDTAAGDGGPEDVLAAHRVMQLTADRAGLLLARDLSSSIRAMFRLWRGYAPELPVAERAGLRVAVARRDDEQRLLHAELAVRTCALIGFYLDDDYRSLDEAGYEPPAGP